MENDKFQLRCKHLDFGRNRSNEPVYPITFADNVINLKETIQESAPSAIFKGNSVLISGKFPTGLNPGDEIPIYDTEHFPEFEYVGKLSKIDTLIMGDEKAGYKTYKCAYKDERESLIVTEIGDVDDTLIYYDDRIKSYYKLEKIDGSSYTPTLIATKSYMNDGLERVNQDTFYYLDVRTATAELDLTPGECPYIRGTDRGELFGVEYILLNGPIFYVRNHPLYGMINFTGRFLAAADDVTIVLRPEIIPAVSNPSILRGHTYEYSILNNVFNLIDVSPYDI